MFEIDGRRVGDEYPLYFIAEAGVNHNCDLVLAKKMVDVAKNAGADCVKFQTFKADNLILRDGPKTEYITRAVGDDKVQSWHDLLREEEMSHEMHVELINYCKKKEITFLSTPYGIEEAEYLDQIGVPAFKVASTDITNLPFLERLTLFKKPIILSTAMATLSEVTDAWKVLSKGPSPFAILQCTGNYPSRIENSNLRVMETYKRLFNCVVGYSDHTLEHVNPIAATTLGAKIYEKHFTLDRDLHGPDHPMSIEPDELVETIKSIRETELALGSSLKFLADEEFETRAKITKSIVTLKKIDAGDELTLENIGVKRPGDGIPPKYLDTILGCKAKRQINANVQLKVKDIDDENSDIWISQFWP